MRATIGLFWKELQRRHVVRVGTVYAVVAWGAVQVVATIYPLLHWPEWTATATVFLAAGGFPVVLILTWIFDLTAEGIRKTPAMVVAPDQQITVAAGTRRAAVGFVGVGILVALAGLAAYARYAPTQTGGPSGARIESIAVLPFIDLSPGKDQEFFSDGITEELLNRLAQIDGLRVPARTSAFAFKGKNENIEEIARKLKVQAVVEGSVRRDGDKLRITAQLIDASTGYHIWSADFDRKAEGVFAVQDEIANAIVAALKMQIAGAEMPMMTDESGTTNMQAHEMYLLGLSAWHKRSPEDLRIALENFSKAVEADPSYAQAYGGLAQTYAVLPLYTNFPVEEAVTKGNAAAARALSINAMLPEAHAAMGQLEQNFEWDVMNAEASYRKALNFKAGYAPAHVWLAEALLIMGRTAEARGEVEQALALDPLSAPAMHMKAYVALVQGDAAGSVEGFRTLLALHPEFTIGQLNLTYAAILARRYDLARSAIAVADPANANAFSTVIRGIADPAQHAAAVTSLKPLENRITPIQLAVWYSALGENEAAIALIQRAAQQHTDGNFLLALVHPLLKPVRSDGRVRKIANELGVK